MLAFDDRRMIFPCESITPHCMGFGSYDESEQESQEYNTDFDEEDGVSTDEHTHEGSVEFEFNSSNEELLDTLKDIKDNT